MAINPVQLPLLQQRFPDIAGQFIRGRESRLAGERQNRLLDIQEGNIRAQRDKQESERQRTLKNAETQFFGRSAEVLERTPPEQLQQAYQQVLAVGTANGVDISDAPDVITPEFITQMKNQAVLQGFKPKDEVTGTASQRDFETFRALQAKAKAPGATQADIDAVNQFGREAGFTRETAQELADIKTQQAISTAEGVAGVALQTKPGIEGAVVTEKGKAEAATELGAAELAAKRLATDETKIKNQQEKLDLIGAKEAAIAEAAGAIGRINGLLLGDRFSSGFGKLVSNTPDTLKSQEAIDVIAELDQIRGLVSLESRQKLKGQGTISDSESKTLEKSATVLSNPLISDNLARKELKKIKKVFERSSSRNQLAKSTREQRLVRQPDQQPQEDLSQLTTEQLQQMLQQAP